MQPLITICARKGSKGVPGKNTRDFNGRPLIEWTIETAIEWGAGPIVISSDDEKVEEIFDDYMYCDIYFDERPEHLARDDTPKLEVLRSVVHKTQAVLGDFDYIVDLDPTNPCRTVEDLENCRRLFEEKKPKTLISVTKAKKNPYMNQIQYTSFAKKPNNKYGIVIDIFVDEYVNYLDSYAPTKNIRRQDAPVVYDVNSNIYFYDIEWLCGEDQSNIPITNKTEIYIMPDHAFCDIDNIVDFEVSGFLHRKYYE